jgi:hypothetical protein
MFLQNCNANQAIIQNNLQTSKTQLDNLTRFQRNINGRYNFIILDDSHTNPDSPYVLTLADQCNQNLFIYTPTNTDDITKNYFVNVPLGVGTPDDAKLWKAWKIVFGFSSIPIDFSVSFTINIRSMTTLSISYGQDSYSKYINPYDYITFPQAAKTPSLWLYQIAGIIFGAIDAEHFKDDGNYSSIYPLIKQYLE